MNPLYYIGAFVVALAILIVFHEFGHYLVARLCGVKVLRFSVGFGRPIWQRRFGADRTEWVLAVFPLGGYVKMLDEREGPVPPEDRPRAFNTQSVARRMAIVSAGPLANFLLAILLHWALFVSGTEELRPVLGQPPAESVAARAGIVPGELVRKLDGQPVATWNELRWLLVDRALHGDVVSLEVENERGEIAYRRLPLDAAALASAETDPLRQMGLVLDRPKLPATIGGVRPDGPAAAAGVKAGDMIVAVDGAPIESWHALVEVVRPAGGRTIELKVHRKGEIISLHLTPEWVEDRGQRYARIGVEVADVPQLRERMMTVVRYGPLDAAVKATRQTWDTAAFSLGILGRMIIGQVSWKNLSGPVTIADYAGQSARAGPSHYLKFLALISISLGVLNLLPIPVLDGGHLMYYMVEVVKGGPVSERALEIGQQIGLALLVMLMAFAFYNDITRLISG